MAALIDSKPVITGQRPLELTIRFRSEDEKEAFKKAVHEAHLGSKEHFIAYAEKNGIALGTSVATD